MVSITTHLTGPIPLVNYASSSTPRTSWYRTIMQVLTRAHHEYRAPLSEEAICLEVRQILDPSYQLEQCIKDLETLKAWSNVTSYYDDSRLDTFETLLHHPQLFQATQAAILLEECFTTIDHSNLVSPPPLHQSDLPQIFHLLQQLDQDLIVPLPTPTFDYAERISGQWERVYTLWEHFAKNAANSLTTISDAIRQPGSNFERFQIYKKRVVTYIHSVARDLLIYSNAIREIFQQWKQQEKEETLFSCFFHFHQQLEHPSFPSNKQALDDLLLHQISHFSHWFEEGASTTHFQRIALAETGKVLQKAMLLSLAQGMAHNLPDQLQLLAQYLFSLQDPSTAQRLFAALFGNSHPIHFDATRPSFAVHPGKHIHPDLGQPGWFSPPLAEYQLPSLTHRTKRSGIRSKELDQDITNALHELRQTVEQEEEGDERLFLEHFLYNMLDLRTLCLLDSPMQRILEHILDECLTHKEGIYEITTRQGEDIRLLHPTTSDLMLLSCQNGTLYLPPYRLVHHFSHKTTHENT